MSTPLSVSDMNRDPAVEWRKYLGLLPAAQQLAVTIEHVPDASVPEPYKTLLVHNDLMTARMEQFHGAPIEVRVLASRLEDLLYSRAIILVRQDTQAAVQFAFAQFETNAVSKVVRDEILSERLPLGRVLLNHGVNYQIERNASLKLTVGAGLSALLRCPLNQTTYGRAARLLCDERPTFEVIEVSAPIMRMSSI